MNRNEINLLSSIEDKLVMIRDGLDKLRECLQAVIAEC